MTKAQQRGLTLIVTSIVGILGYFKGLDVAPVILLGQAITGGLGVVRDR